MSRRLLIGAIALLVLGGGAGALAASQLSGSSGRTAYLDDVAHRLNVTPAALTAAMKQALIDRIQAAVTAGRLTQAQANAIEQRIKQGTGFAFGGPGFGRGFFGHGFFGRHRFFGGHGFFGRPGAAGSAITSYLGISAATLKSDLRAGKTLAQIASATPGKSVAGLEAAIVAVRRTALDKAVADKQLTSQQEQHLLADLNKRVDALVHGTFEPMHPGMRPGFRRFGPGGPPGAVAPAYAPPPGPDLFD